MTPTHLYAHPLVRLLAWLIGSPGLLACTGGSHADVVDDAWCARQLGESRAWLEALDADPQALEAFIALRNIRRVGFLAQALLAFWLSHCGRFELLAENLAVRADGRTLGDFDLLFRGLDGGQPTHWELAVKFYLRLAAPDGMAGYVGPAGQDTLAAKAEHVLTRQLGLGQTAAGRLALANLGIDQIAARAFVKGWLFYPASVEPVATPGLNPAHARGWWRRHVEGEGGVWPVRDRCYRILDRLDWLAWPSAAGQTLDWRELELRMRMHFAAEGGALMVVEFDNCTAQAHETSRGFVMPPQWVGPAAATSQAISAFFRRARCPAGG